MARTVRACPNCGSTDIGHDSMSVIARLSLSGSRACRACGYTGIFPEVDAEEVEDFDGADVEPAETGQGAAAAPSTGRLLVGALLLVLGIAPAFYLSWGEGLLPGLLALAVGAAVLSEELSRRFQAGE